MRWFKHMTALSDDTKVRRLIRKFGAEGYAVYTFALERIAKRLETESPTPDLEETDEDIALHLNMDTARVQDIMRFLLDQELFSQPHGDGRILCLKMYKFIETSQTGNPRFRKMIAGYRESHDSVMTHHDSVSPEQNRTEQNRTEQKEKSASRVVKVTHESLGVPIGSTRYSSLCDQWGKAKVDAAIQARIDWEDSKGKPKAADYAAAAAKWLLMDHPEWPPIKPAKMKGFQERRREEFGE